MRRFALPALCLAFVLLFSACDSGEDEIGAVVITRASITQVEFATGQTEWDDLYLDFKVNGVTVRTTRSDAQNVGSGDLPFDFDFGNDLSLSDLGFALTVEARNREGSIAEDVLIAATAPVSLQSLADSQVAGQTFSSVGGDFSVRLTLRYE